MMLTSSILLAVSFVGIAIMSMREIPESISSIVFLFDGCCRWIWSMWIFCVTFLIAPSLMDAMPDEWRFIGFLQIACLAFVGSMPLFDTEHRNLHNIFGISAGVLSQVCVLIIRPWWLLAWIVFPVTTYYGRDKEWLNGKEVFISECLSMTAMYGSLLTVQITDLI